jgi:transcriptional regulator with GAF, ATPase, and Fis domain
MNALSASTPRLRDESSGTEIPLTGRILTFGASPDCGLQLAGKGVPDRLGHFFYRGGTFEIHVAAAHDAARVNGKPVTQPVALAPNDKLVLGERTFRFLLGQELASAAVPRGPTAPAVETAEPTPLSGIIDALVRLLKDRDPDPFASLVVSVSGLLACDAARVVEEVAGTGERRTLARFPDRSGLERFSNRAIDWARDAQSAVLAQEGEWDHDSSKGSLLRNAVGSVLCVALREEDAIAGYLYLDRTRDSKPFDRKDQALCDSLRPLFELILARRRESERQRETIARLQGAALGEQGGFIFTGQAMERAMDLARRASKTDAVVLIQGETGTGKELLARFIHSQSSRAARPFIALNCGAIPEHLVESELFGHEKGAFTGADRQKPGLFESAGGGTLFLDEIGELPQPIQVKLLRVLQEGEIRRVGGNQSIPVDARILAATHRDLAKEVAEGRFRQDLHFRLNVLNVVLPPLRERGGDILLLAEYLLKKYLLQFGLPPRTFSSLGQSRLMAYRFPGNVRELENVIQKALIISDGIALDLEDLEGEPVSAPAASGAASVQDGQPSTLRAARMTAEHRVIGDALSRTHGNVSAAAKQLDVDRKWLMKLMEEHGLSADAFRK